MTFNEQNTIETALIEHLSRHPITVPPNTSAEESPEYQNSHNDLNWKYIHGDNLVLHGKQPQDVFVDTWLNLPGQVVEIMSQKGYPGFKIHHHTLLWQGKDAKKVGKGYGVQVASTWYWYERWVDKVEEHCRENKEKYTQ